MFCFDIIKSNTSPLDFYSFIVVEGILADTLLKVYDILKASVRGIYYE